jgi:hypothetical protein
VKGYIYSRVFKELGNSSYFFAAICKGSPFSFVMIVVGVCFVFVGEVCVVFVIL